MANSMKPRITPIRTPDDLENLVHPQPRRYASESVDKILTATGKLPEGKATYTGHPLPFNQRCHIQINDGHFSAEFIEKSEATTEQKISRQSALARHLEYAAWTYMVNVESHEDKSPSDWVCYFEGVQAACRKLRDTLNIKDNRNLQHPLQLLSSNYALSPSVVEESIQSIIKLHKEAEKGIVIYNKKKKSYGKRHVADTNLHQLIANLCIAWRDALGKKIAASVNTHDESRGGTMIRFLQAALEPLNIKKSPEALREIVRKVKPTL